MVHRPPLQPRCSSRREDTPASHPCAALCWGGGAVVWLLLGAIALDAAPFGPLARHMGTHLLLMNAVAPLIALAVVAVAPRRARSLALNRSLVTAIVVQLSVLLGLACPCRACRRARSLASSRSLVMAIVVQLSVLWAWHVPAALAVAWRVPAVHALMQSSFLAAALWFWLAVLSDQSAFRWRALFALLMTGKLFCLHGALLVFAPRLLYGDLASHGRHITDSALADQHLAGLLMLAVCPLTYVLAGVIIAAQWLRDLMRAVPGVAPADRNVLMVSQMTPEGEQAI